MPDLLGVASYMRLWETPYGLNRQTLNQRAVGSSPTAPTNSISSMVDRVSPGLIYG
jgi:hypothetical protein